MYQSLKSLPAEAQARPVRSLSCTIMHCNVPGLFHHERDGLSYSADLRSREKWRKYKTGGRNSLCFQEMSFKFFIILKNKILLLVSFSARVAHRTK